MSQPRVIVWAPASSNTATISSLQNYTGAGNLILNSNQPNSPISTYGPYVYDGVARKISFTSANNLSGVNLTINGLGSAVDGNGNPTGSVSSPIVEIIAGPNANTIQSANIYTQINSIAISGAANGLSAGFGNAGITQYMMMDYDRTGWYTTYQTAVYNRTTLTHTVYVSATKPYVINYNQGNISPYALAIPAFSVGAVAATTNQLLTTAYPVAITWANIQANAGETLYFTVLEQGIRS